MANNPITVPLPYDLPENWATNQIVSPDGVSAGLTPQHGFNYLMKQVNNAQQAAQELGEGIAGLSGDNLPVNSGGEETISAALSNKADLTLSNLSDRQKALANIGGRPRKKYIRNWYFAGGGSQQGGGQMPINQRGQTSYTSQNASIPTIDGWTMGHQTTFSLQASGFTLTRNTAEDVPLVDYKLSPGDITELQGKIVSLTLLTDDELITESFPFGNHVIFGTTAQISIINSNTVRISSPSTQQGGTTPTFIAVGLEPCEHQTVAYQDDAGIWQLFETPDYTTELLQCQRHLYVARSDSAHYLYYPGQIAGTDNQIEFMIPMATNMAPPLNFSAETIIVLNESGTAFSTNRDGVFTPTAVRPIGNNVFVYGTVDAISGNLNTSITVGIKGLTITGGD